MINKKEIREISKNIGMPENKIQQILKKTIDSVSKPSLKNIDCPYCEIGVGPSDKV